MEFQMYIDIAHFTLAEKQRLLEDIDSLFQYGRVTQAYPLECTKYCYVNVDHIGLYAFTSIVEDSRFRDVSKGTLLDLKKYLLDSIT